MGTPDQLAACGLHVRMRRNRTLDEPTPKQLAGSWFNYHGAFLRLNADGTFTAASLHSCATTEDTLNFEPDYGQGTWELKPPESHTSTQTLNLNFGPPQNFGWHDWLA